MPDFIAALFASALFCLAFLALNALTRLALQAHLAPDGLMEGGFVQYGGALMVAGAAYRRAVRSGSRLAGE
ncbi:hypothetical protein HNR00_003220 [Methylorubrum rhodinum]|uniref:Uncharacterized protein n=1 Tax=Methylorubrum rhodinum TaxID=29428 RepID=A0A840ZN51_9HYPH|nr:hypothetical protein [Methylorubrum rhodinum]MBB5758498.1 hypothetical protein [Methylorubrum rhodinum]